MKPTEWTMRSRIGPIRLTATADGLTGVFLKKRGTVTVAPLRGSDRAITILRSAARQITEYLAGDRKRFDLPLAAEGTLFQKKVWKCLRRIPYGSTCSYKDVARGIGAPAAVRAVGTANGKNPLCIVIPCHRVIAADGSIGGYSGGLAVKKKLLRLESPRKNPPL